MARTGVESLGVGEAGTWRALDTSVLVLPEKMGRQQSL
jgi:hypothetical protein